MKPASVLLVSLAILSLCSTAALACGPYEWMLPFREVAAGGGEEVSRTGKLPTVHEQGEEGDLQTPTALPLEEAGQIIIQILRSALV